MRLLLGLLLFLVILAAGAVALHPGPPGGGPPGDCLARFYVRQGRYCVKVGDAPPKCRGLPIPAIVAANEDPAARRCSDVEWGFGCHEGLLCGLQQAGPNLVSFETADRIGRARCGRTGPLSC